MPREGDGQRAAAGSDVRCGDARLEFSEAQRFFQQQFGLRSRDEDGRAEVKIYVIKALDADDVGDRFARGAAIDHGLVSGNLLIGQAFVRMREKDSAIDAEQMSKQRLRIKVG